MGAEETWRRTAARLLVALAAVGLFGCDSGHLKTAPVRGKITYRTKPVTRGTINFVPEVPGPTATGEIQPDGSYVLTTYKARDGAVLGKHRVMIISLDDGPGRLPEQRNPLPAMLLPEHYSNDQRSGLTAEVKDEPNTIDFPLE